MTLSVEQLEIRKTGIGASEVSEIIGTNPYRQAIDVWLRKTGRDESEQATPVADDDDEDAEDYAPNELGSGLEEAICGLYSEKTGRRAKFLRGVTRRHPEFEHVLCSPDADVIDHPTIRGAEIKLVGAKMLHHWRDESTPDYVVDQVQQAMEVHDAEAWDVVALLGGTDLRITTIERNRDHGLTLVEACEMFWISHVETDIPPEIVDPFRKRAEMRRRYPGSEATATRDESDDEALAMAVRWYAEAAQLEKLAKAKRLELEAMICGVVGEDYGVSGPWGKFLWFPVQGRTSWQAIAKELAGGSVPAELVEKHRGKSSRTAKLYPFNPKRPGAKKGSR